MNVLHVIPSISPKHGGPSYAMHAFAEALRRVGVNVTIATTDDHGADDKLDVPLNRLVDGGDAQYIYFRRSFVPYKVSFGLARWLHHNVQKFELVHIHALFSYASMAAASAARRRHVPYLVRPLGVLNRWGLVYRRPLLKTFSLRFVELPLLRNAAALHFTSQAEAGEAAQVDPLIGRLRHAVIPVPVQPVAAGNASMFYAAFPKTRTREVVLFLSRLHEKKGLELLLQSFAVVRERKANVALVIAGSGESGYVARLRTIAGKLGVADEIVWTGHLKGELKAAALAAAAVFVLPSASENFGIAPVEAMSAGVPTIVSPEVAVSREIAAYAAGLVVEREAGALAEAIITLLSNPERARELGISGRQMVEKCYSADAVGGALRQLYETCIAAND